VNKPDAGKPRDLKTGSYMVQRGDTLYAIAWRSNNDFRDLARWNRIASPYIIHVGQRLRLSPPPAQRAAASASAKKTPVPQRPAVRRQQVESKPKKPPLRARKPTRGLTWDWPVKGRLLARFHPGDPLRKGIKLGGRPGTPIKATEAGKVVYSGSGLIGYGKLVIVKHNDEYLSAYGHNRKLLVREGERVSRGQKIAELGKANDGQAMLHFEIRRDGKPINPIKLLPER